MLWQGRECSLRAFEREDVSQIQVGEVYDEGWQLLLDTIGDLRTEDLDQIVYIRSMGHTVREAIHRQLAHYAYHVGQIVYHR